MLDEKTKKEVSTFIREPIKISLHNGETITVSPLSWKKELQFLKILGDFVEAFNEEINLIGVGEEISLSENLSTTKLFSVILKQAPDLLTELVQIITEMDREKIENELVLEDIMEIVTPFLSDIIIRLRKIFQEKIRVLLQNQQK